MTRVCLRCLYSQVAPLGFSQTFVFCVRAHYCKKRLTSHNLKTTGGDPGKAIDRPVPTLQICFPTPVTYSQACILVTLIGDIGMNGEQQFYLLTQSLCFIYININRQGSSHHSQSRKKHAVSIQGGGDPITTFRKDKRCVVVSCCKMH